MAYSTPPTFATGQIVTAGQMNVLADDVIWLHGQATRPQAPQLRLRGKPQPGTAEQVFGYSWGIKKVNQNILDIRGRIYNEGGAGTTIVVKAYLMCKMEAGTSRRNPVWPTDAQLLFTETQTGLGIEQINQTYDLTDIVDEDAQPATNEMYQVWFTYDTTGGGGGLSSYVDIHHVFEGGRALAAYATPYLPTDGNAPSAVNLNTYKLAIGDLRIASLAPVPGFRYQEYGGWGSHDVAEVAFGTSWHVHRPGCDALYVHCDVSLSESKPSATARLNVYTLQLDGTETLVSGATLVRSKKIGPSTYTETLDISGVGLAANERYAVVCKYVATGTGDAVDGTAKVYYIGEVGDGPAAYEEPGEWAAKQKLYGTTAGQTTRLELLRTDIMALAGDTGSGYTASAAATVYRNFHNLTPARLEDFEHGHERMHFIRTDGFETLKYRVLNATLYWGDVDEPESQRLMDMSGGTTPYDAASESMQYRQLDLAALRTLAAGMEFWIEVGERSGSDTVLPQIVFAVVDA